MGHCIKCKNLLELMKHPHNETIGKGSANEKMGYCCTAQDGETKNAVFFERLDSNSVCELFVSKFK